MILLRHARPEPTRCPDCASLTPGEHKPWCVIANATPLPCATEIEAMRRLYLVEPRTAVVDPIKVALTDKMLAIAFAEGWDL